MFYNHFSHFLDQHHYTHRLEQISQKIYPFWYPLSSITSREKCIQKDNKTEYVYFTEGTHITEHTWYKDFDTDIQSGLVLEVFEKSYSWKMGKSREKGDIFSILRWIWMQVHHLKYFHLHISEHQEFLQYIFDTGYILKKFFLRDNLHTQIFEKEYSEVWESELHTYFTEPLLVLYFVHENGNHFCCELHSSECAF